MLLFGRLGGQQAEVRRRESGRTLNIKQWHGTKADYILSCFLFFLSFRADICARVSQSAQETLEGRDVSHKAAAACNCTRMKEIIFEDVKLERSGPCADSQFLCLLALRQALPLNGNSRYSPETRHFSVDSKFCSHCLYPVTDPLLPPHVEYIPVMGTKCKQLTF